MTILNIVASIQGQEAKCHWIGFDEVVDISCITGLNDIENIVLRTTPRTNRKADMNNAGSIICSVHDRDGIPRLLMPADPSFCYIHQTQKGGGSLDYLLATHHGSKMSIVDFVGQDSIPSPRTSHVSQVFFSYQDGNRYGHGYQNVRAMYEQNGWIITVAGEVLATVNAHNYIVIQIELDGNKARFEPVIRF